MRIAKQLFIAILSMVALASCSHKIFYAKFGSSKNPTPGYPSIVSYINEVMEKTPDIGFEINGQFSLNPSVVFQPYPINFAGGCKAPYSTKKHMHFIDAGPVNVGGHFVYASQNQYKNYYYTGYKLFDDSVFGKTLPFVLAGKGAVNNANNSSDGFLLNDSLYIPQMLEFKKPSINTFPSTDTNFIAPGEVFEWQPDANNAKNGIIIMLEYDPNAFENDSLRKTIKTAFPKFIHNGCVVPDNGRCALDKNLFTGLPRNAHLRIQLIRENYKTGKTITRKTYRLLAYSMRWFEFVYK